MLYIMYLKAPNNAQCKNKLFWLKNVGVIQI